GCGRRGSGLPRCASRGRRPRARRFSRRRRPAPTASERMVASFAMRVLVVHPPLSVARDFIDYPYFSDLGAVQLAAVLAERGFEVQLVDAFALPDSDLIGRPDGRAHLGAPVESVLAAAGEYDVAVLAYTPFHRPPARDDVLGALLAGLRGPILLADC